MSKARNTQPLAAPAAVSERETATAMLGAQARAEIESIFALADARPRNEDLACARLLSACKRPRFAEGAIYRKPVGKEKDDHGHWHDKFVIGLSVRFAEEARRLWGNMLVRTFVTYEDEHVRHIQARAIDLETRAIAETPMVITKTVERKSIRQGDEVLGERETSDGGRVYLLRANDDQMLIKGQNLAAKQRRDLILQLLPADLKEDCLSQCLDTVAPSRVSGDDAAKRMVDAFNSAGISPKQLAEYVGRPVDKFSAEDFVEMRQVYNSLSQGEASWDEFVAERADKRR